MEVSLKTEQQDEHCFKRGISCSVFQEWCWGVMQLHLSDICPLGTMDVYNPGLPETIAPWTVSAMVS